MCAIEITDFDNGSDNTTNWKRAKKPSGKPGKRQKIRIKLKGLGDDDLVTVSLSGIDYNWTPNYFTFDQCDLSDDGKKLVIRADPVARPNRLRPAGTKREADADVPIVDELEVTVTSYAAPANPATKQIPVTVDP